MSPHKLELMIGDLFEIQGTSIACSHILILSCIGDDTKYWLIKESSFVHVDDVARAQIHLLEHPEAKGRYIVNRVEVKIEELSDFLSANYPQYKMPSPE